MIKETFNTASFQEETALLVANLLPNQEDETRSQAASTVSTTDPSFDLEEVERVFDEEENDLFCLEEEEETKENFQKPKKWAAIYESNAENLNLKKRFSAFEIEEDSLRKWAIRNKRKMAKKSECGGVEETKTRKAFWKAG